MTTEESAKASGLENGQGRVGIAGLLGFGRKALPNTEDSLEQTGELPEVEVSEQLTRVSFHIEFLEIKSYVS